MTKPFFTVVIPTWNRAEMLRECISNILRQSYQDLELIVVDNGSTDGTQGMVREFTDSRLHYHRHDRNIGGFENWIYSAKQGCGEFIVMHQDDDFIHQDFLLRCHETVTCESDVTMYGGAYAAGSAQAGYSSMLLPDMEENRDDWPLRGKPLIVDGRRMALRFLLNFYMNHPGVALRRSALERAGGYGISPDLLGDMVTLPRVMALGRVAYDPRLSGVYRIHPGRNSTNFGKATRARLMHNSYRFLVESYDELMPGWQELFRKELSTVQMKPLFRVLKDFVGFGAPPALTQIVWERFQVLEPDRLRLYRKILTKIGFKNTCRLLLGIQRKVS